MSGALVVAEAVNGSHRLVAYCTLSNGADRTSRALLHGLRERLPDYMVPSALVMLDAFPLTVNGKVDRARLPAPTAETGGEAPATPAEALLCRAMATVLKLAAVGADADFFALGGDSISAIALGSALRAHGFELRPRDVFAGRDPRRMALALKALAPEGRARRRCRFCPCRRACCSKASSAGRPAPTTPSPPWTSTGRWTRSG